MTVVSKHQFRGFFGLLFFLHILPKPWCTNFPIMYSLFTINVTYHNVPIYECSQIPMYQHLRYFVNKQMQLITKIPFCLIFSDPAVQALQFLDIIGMKDPSQKAQFFRTTLTQVFPYIPRVKHNFSHLSAVCFQFYLYRNCGSSTRGQF